jgi:hypothetical protein
MTPEDVAAQNQTRRLLSQIGIEISGATVSEPERQLMKSYLPEMTSSEEAFNENLDKLIVTLKTNARGLYKENGLEVPDDLEALIAGLEEVAEEAPAEKTTAASAEEVPEDDPLFGLTPEERREYQGL